MLDANRCVKCAICLPVCPSYAATANEACSPRGRLALVQALDTGSITVDARLNTLLDACLFCRRCDKACPLDIPVTRIIDAGLARSFSAVPRWKRQLARGLVGGKFEPLLKLASGWRGKNGALLAALRPVRKPLQAEYAAEGEAQGRVLLWPGCSGRLLDAPGVEAAICLLQRAGYQVVIPPRLGCCGAQSQHSGDVDQAQHLQASALAQIQSAGPLDAILSLASGCGAHVGEYAGLPAPHYDLIEFLLQSGVLARLDFRPLDALAIIHQPCSSTLEQAGLQRILGKIPGLRLEFLHMEVGCCGAGGMKFLEHSAQAEALRRPLVKQIEAASADFLLSVNPACNLHLGLGVESPGIEYLHPASLLARQLI